MLQETFVELASAYCNDSTQVQRCWEELEKEYANTTRHYHNLQHLRAVLLQLTPVRNLIEDWDAVLFALYYHDAVYKPTRKDNELQSAKLAHTRLEALGVPQTRIQRCINHILATQNHNLSADPDTNLFTDADLSVLGADWQTYQQYSQQIANEYALVPKLLYKHGRRKVLTQLLQMERLFKTSYFFEKLETQARSNLRQEVG